MRVKGFVGMLKKLIFKSVSQIKHDFVSVSFNSKGEEINFKIYIVIGQVLKSKSELSAQDEDFDSLVSKQCFFMCFHELGDMIVRENDLITFSFVIDQD